LVGKPSGKRLVILYSMWQNDNRNVKLWYYFKYLKQLYSTHLGMPQQAVERYRCFKHMCLPVEKSPVVTSKVSFIVYTKCSALFHFVQQLASWQKRWLSSLTDMRTECSQEQKCHSCPSLAQSLNEIWCSETKLHYSLPMYSL
jgi:hypothetical protein